MIHFLLIWPTDPQKHAVATRIAQRMMQQLEGCILSTLSDDDLLKLPTENEHYNWRERQLTTQLEDALIDYLVDFESSLRSHRLRHRLRVVDFDLGAGFWRIFWPGKLAQTPYDETQYLAQCLQRLSVFDL